MERYSGVTDARIGWFAGILDGEGSLSIHPQTRLKSGRVSWGYAVVITNSDPRLLRRATEIILAITNKMPYIVLKQPGIGKSPIPTFNVKLQGKREIRLLLEAVFPYLEAKQDQAAILLAVLRSLDGTGRQRIRDRRLVLDSATRMRELKHRHADAEVTLAGLRSLEHRNDYGVSANDNPRTSARPEREDIV